MGNPFSDETTAALLAWDRAVTRELEALCACSKWEKTGTLDTETSEFKIFCPRCKAEKVIVPGDPPAVVARRKADRDRAMQFMRDMGRAAGEELNRVMTEAFKR